MDAFGYTNITSANLSKLETLDRYSFYQCEKLEKVTLPSTIDEIQIRTFYNCISLTTINLSNVKTIGTSAFYGCKNLKNVDLSKVTDLGDTSFKGCSSLNSSLTLNNVEIHTEALCNTGVTSLTINGNSTIYERGLYSTSGINTVYITGATTVKKWAAGFNGFTNDSLEAVYITGAATLADVAFGYATKLKTFQETNGNVTYGGSSIFEGCTSISDVIIKTDYSNRLFVGATIPSDATIDFGITSISDYNKLDLKLFDRVKLNSITGISSLSSSISTTIKYFEARSATSFYYASSFKDKTQLEEVVLPKITKILYSTFQGCTSLKTVDISAATEIGDDAFQGCTSLKTVYAPKLQTIDYKGFKDCTALSSITLNACTSIGSYAFSDCTSLSSIYAQNVTSVSSYAFYNTKLTTLNGMPNLTSIGAYAFSKSMLYSIEFNADINATNIGENAFAELRTYSDSTGNRERYVTITLNSSNYMSFVALGETSVGGLLTNNIKQLTFRSYDTSFTELDFEVLYLNNTLISTTFAYDENTYPKLDSQGGTFVLYRRS